jgi:membrane-associated phospholipid phosphatase
METIILQFFETLRSDLATLVACLFSLFGETMFLVVLLCAIYWIFDKKLGERILLVTFSSMGLNGGLKTLFGRTRPYAAGVVSRVEVDNPLISTIELDPQASFPSGHSQMAGGLFFSCALHTRKAWGWIIFPLLTLGVMLSRLYFGVHYPTDVLVGAALGIAFAFFWHYVYEKATDTQVYYLALGFAALSIVGTIIFPSENLVKLCACMVAAAICWPLEKKFIGFENATCAKHRVYRSLIGLVCVGIIFGLFSYMPFAFVEHLAWKFAKYFLTLATGSLLVPYLFIKLKI